MLVAMVQVRVVRMRVHQSTVTVPVRVGLAGRVCRRVLMPMMRVMHVPVLVLERLVDVLVLMTLGEMQPHANGHEDARGSQLPSDRLREEDEREHGADERRG